MNDDLYFLPLIIEALQKPESQIALKQAFERIKELGQQPQYKTGFIQFQRFMAEVNKASEIKTEIPDDVIHEILQDLVLELTTGQLDDKKESRDILNLIISRPEWREEFEKLREEITMPESQFRQTEIIIEKDGKRFGIFSVGKSSNIIKVAGIKPAHYSFLLSTGRLIWEGNLTEKELLWSFAFPERDLEMAAKTDDMIKRTTREIKALKGEVIIRVFPEIESGNLEIEIRTRSNG